MKYLSPSDTDAFKDYPSKLSKPDWALDFVECPLCKGYGGWNLALNAFKLYDKADSSENRHKFSHFRSNCSQCNGWGWTHSSNIKCIHTWVRNKKLANCLHEFKCSKCEVTQEIDSSG